VFIIYIYLLFIILLLLLLPAGSAAGSSAGISFTHRPILGFFAPQGRRSSLPNLTLIGSGVGVYGPQN